MSERVMNYALLFGVASLSTDLIVRVLQIQATGAGFLALTLLQFAVALFALSRVRLNRINREAEQAPNNDPLMPFYVASQQESNKDA